MHVSCFSRVQLFATLWTVLCAWDSPGKNTGVGCYFLLQGIFSIAGLNPRLLHWQVDSLLLSHQGSPIYVYVYVYVYVCIYVYVYIYVFSDFFSLIDYYKTLRV